MIETFKQARQLIRNFPDLDLTITISGVMVSDAIIISSCYDGEVISDADAHCYHVVWREKGSKIVCVSDGINDYQFNPTEKTR